MTDPPAVHPYVIQKSYSFHSSCRIAVGFTMGMENPPPAPVENVLSQQIPTLSKMSKTLSILCLRRIGKSINFATSNGSPLSLAGCS